MLRLALIFVVISALLGSIVLWYVTHTPNGYQTPSVTNPENLVPHSSNNGVVPTISWRFVPAPADVSPKTKVTILSNGEPHDVGIYDGSCSEINAGSLMPNEIAGVLCFWAGSGDEIGVFKEGKGYVVKHGEQQEPDGENQGFRGNFTTLFAL